LPSFLQENQSLTDYRILEHPILNIPIRNTITFTWQDLLLSAKEGETIALFASVAASLERADD
jgi:hypothetical protein